MSARSIWGIGALYEDIVLAVPHYPDEDSKLRATTTERRLGGNIINTFEVLSEAPLHISTTFCASVGDKGSCRWIADDLEKRRIYGRLIYRSCASGPARAYIICSEENGSRTIISHGNGIDDPTVEELKEQFLSPGGRQTWPDWIHVEGRNCGATVEFLDGLREDGYGGKISVDLERPRPGLLDLLSRADVLFVSETYARETSSGLDEGDRSAATDLKREGIASRDDEWLLRQFLACIHGELKADAIGYLTVGSKGSWTFARRSSASALRLPSTVTADLGGDDRFTCVRTPAVSLPRGEVVESIGAGDTFIAGAIYGLAVADMGAAEAGCFATTLAGRKCTQRGFGGLWECAAGSSETN